VEYATGHFLSTTDGRWLIMQRHTEPEPEKRMLLEKLKLTLPPQPPPRIRGGKLLMPEPRAPAGEGRERVVET